MNMRDNFFFFWWLSGLIFSLVLFSAAHEMAHKEICEGFGGEAHINGFALDGFNVIQSTTCYMPPLTADRRNAYDTADLGIEGTYVYQSLIVAMFICVYLLKHAFSERDAGYSY